MKISKGLISVIFVYGIILSEYYMFVFHYLPYRYSQNSLSTILIGIEFTLIYIMIHWAYLQAQIQSPGHPPSDLANHYQHQTLEEIKNRTKKHAEIINKKRKQKLMKRYELAVDEEDEIFDIVQAIQLDTYCFKCENVKLPRTHHCKECNKCILRMDHHCPWVNNCIGLKNHRFFCQFIAYALGCMFQCFFFITEDFINGTFLTGNSRFLCQICAFTCLALCTAMGGLLAFHLYHISKNVTTVEYHIEEMKTDNPFQKQKTIDNFREIFGYEWKYWFLPITEDLLKRKEQKQDSFEL